LLEHVERMGTMGNGYKIVVGKPEARRPFGRRGHGWEDNIRMDLREVEWEVMDLIHLAQDRDQWRTVSGSIKGEEFVD